MKTTWLLASLITLAASAAMAQDAPIVLTIKDHKFEPAELKVPANKKVKIIVKNLDATAEEFESHSLNREKIISGNSEAPVMVGPLKPGKYEFFGEFNPKTAQGVLIAE